MPETVVGLFRTRGEAENALRQLERAGFTSSDISIVTPRPAREGRWGAKLVVGLAIGTALGAVVGNSPQAGQVRRVPPIAPG